MLALLALLAVAASLPAQAGVVGAIEIYGTTAVAPDEVRRALGVAPGDPVPAQGGPLRERLLNLPGVTDAAIHVVCCESGRSIVYAGVRDGSAPAMDVRPAPTGITTVPYELVTAEADFTAALGEAVERGQADEDHSAGHALMAYPPARAVQMRFIALAQMHEERLREVLATSRFPLQRALAAQVLAYLPDKTRAAEVLAPALRDASPAVRNDAARALWIIADFARDKPELRARIPGDAVIGMMQSLDWTDRNKASLVLMALTSARDSALLSAIDERIRPELEEMARWNTQHALPAFVILGRVRGMSDEEIFAAWTSGEKARILGRRSSSGPV